MLTVPPAAEAATPVSSRPRHASLRVRAGQVVLTVLLVLIAVVAASTAFSDDPFPAPAIVLLASFGLLASAFGLVATWSTDRSRMARIAVWALPLFFVWHVAALHTWIPDALFAVAAAVGALLAGAGQRRTDDRQH